MQTHLRLERLGGQLRKARHRPEIRTASCGQREQPGILDQKYIILPNPELEPLEANRPLADAAHERMGVLGLPDSSRFFSQALAESLRHLARPVSSCQSLLLPPAHPNTSAHTLAAYELRGV